MNNIALYSLIILIIIRTIGLAISIEFFVNLRRKRFIALIAGWACWVVTGSIPLLAEYIYQEQLKQFLYIINASLATVGLLLLFLGILSYFSFIPGKIMFLITITYMLIPILFYYFINSTFAMSFSILFNFANYLSIFIIVLYKRAKVNEVIKEGVNWLYLTLFVVLSYLGTVLYFILVMKDEYSYGLYNTSNELAVMINYTFAILITILLIVLFIYFERSISSRNMYNLKDMYSHNIGNILQVIISASSIIETKEALQEKEKEKLILIQKKCDEASDLIHKIRGL